MFGRWKFLFFFLLSCRALASVEVKVTTFNTMLVCVGPGCVLAQEPDLEKRAIGIGKWLKDSGADIVFLQEVLQKRHFDLIVENAGFPHAWFVHSGTGLAILSKYPLSKMTWTPFRWQGGYFRDCKRLFARIKLGVGLAEVTLPGGESWRLAVTHLLPRYTEVQGFAEPADAHTPERKILTLEIAKLLGEQAGKKPLILGGDFNLNQVSAEYPFLKNALSLADALQVGFAGTEESWKNLCTYCGTNPHVLRQKNEDEKALDHVFVAPSAFTVLSSRVPTTTDELSDHRAVEVTLRRTETVDSFVPKYPPQEVDALVKYIKEVSIHPVCYLAPLTGWVQRSKTKAFLESLGK